MTTEMMQKHQYFGVIIVDLEGLFWFTFISSTQQINLCSKSTERMLNELIKLAQS